jgi:hypothetical protein
VDGHDGVPIVLQSAMRHDIEESDMLHAYAHGTPAALPDDEGLLMIVGPARNGTAMIEVGVIVWHDMHAIAHATPARPTFFRPDHRR